MFYIVVVVIMVIIVVVVIMIIIVVIMVIVVVIMVIIVVVIMVIIVVIMVIIVVICHLHSMMLVVSFIMLFLSPKLLYVLLTTPYFLSSYLKSFDELHKSLLEIINISISGSAWSQASLPVSSGGLGSEVLCNWHHQLFFVSATTSLELQSPGSTNPFFFYLAAVQRSQSHNVTPPSWPVSSKLKIWDAPVVKATYDQLLEESNSDHNQACLLSAAQKESGACVAACSSNIFSWFEDGGQCGTRCFWVAFGHAPLSAACVSTLWNTGGPIGYIWTQLPQESGSLFFSCLYQCSHQEGTRQQKSHLIWNPGASDDQMAEGLVE